MSTSLTWLLDGIAAVPANEARVEDLTLDSREARAGSLFLALQGRTTHGLKFAAQAAARGASVVLWEPGPDVSPPRLPDPPLSPRSAGCAPAVTRSATALRGSLPVTRLSPTRTASAPAAA